MNASSRTDIVCNLPVSLLINNKHSVAAHCANLLLKILATVKRWALVVGVEKLKWISRKQVRTTHSHHGYIIL